MRLTEIIFEEINYGTNFSFPTTPKTWINFWINPIDGRTITHSPEIEHWKIVLDYPKLFGFFEDLKTRSMDKIYRAAFTKGWIRGIISSGSGDTPQRPI